MRSVRARERPADGAHERTGAASKAGHDLLIEVTSWSATLDPEADPALTLSADSALAARAGGDRWHPGARRRRQGRNRADHRRGGPRGARRSSSARRPSSGRPAGSRASSSSRGERQPIGFELAATRTDGSAGSAIVRQSDWGMKPYSALFGTLKVADEVEVAVETAALVAVDGLRVESALHARRQRARAVGVHGEVGDRPRLRAESPVATNAPLSHVRLSGSAPSATPASSCALSRILPVALTIAASVPPDGLVLNPWPSPKRSVSAGTTLTSSGGTPSSLGHQLGVAGSRCRRARWSG